MTQTGSSPTQRADARRSRARILAAAATAFARDAAPTFKDIARDAGVGIGTMFRHFPTREALVEEVFRTELQTLCADAATLVAALPADEALREWMSRWAAFVATKQGMSDVLKSLTSSGSVTKSESATLLTHAVQVILDAGEASSILRSDVRADDIVAALSGILVVADPVADDGRTARLLALLMDGLTNRARPSRS
ncbi:TetR/AcrR family transcriptional regulator [Catenuloplanes indicus]|uniref:AcrR family transcriptional regulator n=1 Tax=Catenuloplanes indicus TaxID=137267 RepID=A0AAE4B2T8_9ACTN|nr:TetR/AcrR family transcriptional regulator [Catenuloplanes indicus]MDQ0369348.1 AcrR family transcriptional regulator [Catenuloplanes indicus]